MMRLPIPAMMIVAESIVRRPYLSAMGDRMNAPIGRPMKPKANTE